MLRLNNIDVTLSKNTVLAKKVLTDFDLSVESGEFVMIVGSNGCGKSTLLNTIAGHIRPDSGSILIDDMDVTDQNCESRVGLVSLVMQDPRIGTVETMTIAENLNLGFMRGRARKLQLHNTKARRKYFAEKLSLLKMGLEHRLDDLAGNLSGGQRQALSLIMAVIADYKIILLDEITAALDPTMAELVIDLASKLVADERRTAIMITHNMQHALRYGTRTVLMRDGKIVNEYTHAKRQDLTPVALAAELGNIY